MRVFAQKQTPSQRKDSSNLIRPATRTSAPAHHPSGFAHDFSRIPVHAPAIHQPGSEHGQNADAAREAAERGVSGSGGPLPHADAIQISFGRHDVSSIRAHVGGLAAGASRAIGATAYALGSSVAFSSTPDLHLAAHEAAHVVQQRAGVSPSRGVGQPGDPYEQHADAVAARVVEGRSAEPLLDRHTAGGSAVPVVQRFAFLNEVQIKKSETDFTPAMNGFLKDSVVRNYDSVDELKKHSDKQTDYLGNLKDGTWMRFSPSGTNLLGEFHTEVTLLNVLPAVGSKSFIYEPFSPDPLKAGSEIQKAYTAETQARFKEAGVETVKDKQQFGAESLFPKMGYALTLALPHFEGKKPMSQLTKGDYVGQPVQRYLKIAWAFSKDNKQDVDQKLKAKQDVPPKFAKLASVHTAVEGQLDTFITSLAVDGYLGDELGKKANAGLLAPLAQFAQAFTEAVVRMAASDPSSRLSTGQRLALSGSSTTKEAAKMKLFSEWRDFQFEDNVKAATRRGVRYAGMGQAHLDHLVAIGLEKDQHPFEMASTGKDMTAFKALTKKLGKAAK